jgi:hypothetical protein
LSSNQVQRAPRSQRGKSLFAALVSLGLAAYGAANLIGHPARAVHVLSVFAGGLGAGAGLARALTTWRASARDAIIAAVSPSSVPGRD